MIKCLYCNAETNNPKFCNSSCAAKYNNKNRNFNPGEDKRTKIAECIYCQKEIEVNIRAAQNKCSCDDCKIKRTKCSYKCGNFAKFKLSNGKYCCSVHHNSCPKIKEKNRLGCLKAHNEGRKTYNYNPKSNWVKNSEKGKILIAEIIKRDFVKNSNSSKIKYYFVEYIIDEYKCKICDLKDWQNKEINLHLDHINGDRHDNRIENLRLICPNCHSQTPTYCGRNINNGKYVATDVELICAIKENKNIRQALLSAGLAPKGANYERVNKLVHQHNLKFKKMGA